MVGEESALRPESGDHRAPSPPPPPIIYQFQLALNICRALARFTVMGHETRLFTELNCWNRWLVVSAEPGPRRKRESSAVYPAGRKSWTEDGGRKEGECNARSFEFPLNRTGNSSTLSPAIYSRTIPCPVCFLISWGNSPLSTPEMEMVMVVFSDSENVWKEVSKLEISWNGQLEKEKWFIKGWIKVVLFRSRILLEWILIYARRELLGNLIWRRE